MALPVVPATNIGMSDLAVACGVDIQTNLSLNGLRAGSGGDLTMTHTNSGETLAETLTTSETGVDVSDGSAFSIGQYIVIGTEIMFIQNISTNTLTVKRNESSLENAEDPTGDGLIGDEHNSGATIYYANPFVEYVYPTNLDIGGGLIEVYGYLTSWLQADELGTGYGLNTTNIGMKDTFYTNAGSGRAADTDGYVGA